MVREKVEAFGRYEEWEPRRVVEWILACRRDEGIPMFKPRFAGGHFEVEGKPAVMGVCLTPTTSIMVDNFIYMPISKLYEKFISGRNLSIMGFDFLNNSFIKTQILDAQKSKPEKIFEIKLDKTKIKCTPEHPFFRNTQNNIELVNAFNLKVGDLLPLIVNYEQNKRFWVGGLFAGDGWIHYRKGKEADSCIASISLNLLKEVSEFLEEIGIKTTIFNKKLHKPHFGNNPIYNLYIPKKFLNKLKEWSKLPNSFEFLNSWLSGFFDAEGHITIYNKEDKHHAIIGLTNSNLDLLSKIQKILDERYKIKSTIVKDKRKENLWQLLIKRNLDIIKFSELIGFSHPEKKEKLKYFLEEILPKSLKSLEARIYNVLEDPKTLREINEIVKANKTNIRKAITNLTKKGEILRIDKSFYIRNIKNPTIKWLPIREIKEKDGQYTFDFTTNIGNFIANNIITHNCWAGRDGVGMAMFKNVKEEDIKLIEEGTGDWRKLIEKYGSREDVEKAESYGIYIKGFKLPRIIRS